MFKELYQHIYEICRNTEAIMGIFSEELAIMDRNTVDYMIDRLQKENTQLQDKNTKLQGENTQLQMQIKRMQAEYEQLRNSIGK